MPEGLFMETTLQKKVKKNSMANRCIYNRLISLSDTKYAEFQRKLIPNIQPDTIIGVRTPALRDLAKEMFKSGRWESFIALLPHGYFEENQLHAFIISLIKDYGKCIGEVERFLPHLDNWATCDQLLPKCFDKHRDELLPYIERWIRDKHEYSVRFAIGVLMRYFLDDAFEPRFLDSVVSIRREEYYIRMMQAWYFATALAKQYDAALPYIEQRKLAQWTHNKAIQKAIESYRVTSEHKDKLRSLRW